MTIKAVTLINYLTLSLYINYIGNLIYKPSKKQLTKELIGIIIIIIIMYLTSTLNNFYHLLYFFSIIYYKLIYRKNTYLSIYATLILITILSLSKLIILLLFNTTSFVPTLILSFFLTFLLKRKIIHFTKTSLNITLLIYILLNLNLISTIIKSNIDNIFLQNIIIYILISLFIIIIVLQEQKLEKLKLLNKEFQKYSKTEEDIITSYKKSTHEYKNKLIIIKSMINYKDKKVLKYLNYLIDDPILKENKWLYDLRYIPFPEIKNFINYKMNILEKYNAIIELYIDSNISLIIQKKVNMIIISNINTILGIIMDNIIDSIKENNEKLVSINMYIEKDTINIIFANTFSNKIDLKFINKLGYSTKGLKRGVGLSLANDIVKTNKYLELDTRIEDKFFVQHLKINNIKKYMK